VIAYRAFRNTDPPRLFSLWRSCGLGRSAAQPISLIEFELPVFSLPYFDPAGLIVAEDAGQLVGFVHAGFGFTADEARLDRSQGVICAVGVHPSRRRQGIGTALVRFAEDYLRAHGAARIQFGQARLRDPFYFGLLGGARPAGVFDSDPHLGAFLSHIGYQRGAGTTILQRDLTSSRDPMNFRLIGLRRQTEVVVDEPAGPHSFAWYCRMGNLESLKYTLLIKKSQTPIADVTVIGLDHYQKCWGERAIGLVDMNVVEQYRGQGYGTTLLIEALRKIRAEMNVTLAELHVADDQIGGQKVVRNAGFIPLEKAYVYDLRDD
jgi:ribosomal protein S18 acetylase RimI-like enzyme